MSYRETIEAGLTTIEITCDARKGKHDICGNEAAVTMNSRDVVTSFLYALGWRLLRGHQVCAQCLNNGKVTFPRSKET